MMDREEPICYDLGAAGPHNSKEKTWIALIWCLQKSFVQEQPSIATQFCHLKTMINAQIKRLLAVTYHIISLLMWDTSSTYSMIAKEQRLGWGKGNTISKSA